MVAWYPLLTTQWPSSHTHSSLCIRRENIHNGLEILALPLEEANKLLASGSYEPVGTDPIKIIDHQFFVVLGKKEKVQ